MTYKEFCKLVRQGANPYLLALEDPSLEEHLDRWDAETRDVIYDPPRLNIDWVATTIWIIVPLAMLAWFWWTFAKVIRWVFGI